MIVREVLPGEAEAVGALRVEAYKGGGFLSGASGYTDTLRVLGLGTAGGPGGGSGEGGRVFVAVEDGPDASSAERAAGHDPKKLLGTVMLDPWHAGSEVSRNDGDAEVRAFAVAPWAQGRGVGRVLMRAVIDAAAASGARRLLLSTQPEMEAAQHLYRSLGFVRMPELDWAPVPEVPLLGFGLPLNGR
ncbi:MAG TPA: GNAT family N-acetyltransferase [Trebonia sp.]|nr:GNAT family N-acetyltransferase [Trebonia sp.]